MLATSVWQSFSVQGQLNAAIATNRAWVQIEPKMSTPITFDDEGGRFTVSVVVKNIGRSPATSIGIGAIGGTLVFGVPRSPQEELLPACKKARDDFIAPMVLFPDETRTRTLPVYIDRAEIDRAVLPGTPSRGDALIPLLYLCATYKDAGGGATTPRTGFAYTVGLKADDPDNFKTVTIDGSGTVAEDFVIKRDFYGASIAD